MKAISLTVSLCCILSSGLSQSRHFSPMKAGPLRLDAPAAMRSVAAQDTVRVLALMVQFKADLEPRTSGNGMFMLSGSQSQIDPPPHDSSFVANKLRFLTNYFKRVSNGTVVVQAEVFSPMVTLADSMAAYSPQRAGTDRPVAQLIVDSWSAAGALRPLFPFSSYDAFIIFHAGVGRDIDLISILGYDPTPYDLPSLFVDLSSLRRLLDDPAYAGVPVNGGAFRIDHSIILPETETRVFSSGTQADTLQLSTNGLLAASFGSYLGLPDLFDTKTGRSGIGQFGLMDGASIFAYSGLFPPEPSAWEKMRLGWITPLDVSGSVQNIQIPPVGLTNTGQDSIYRVGITSSEYFLIENRSRDANNDGQVLTIVQNGIDVIRSFGTDTVGFVFNDVGAITGSVVDVEDFDWAISGDKTQQGFEGGGILIWHIDEEVIARNIATNTVNADPLHRGVDLEEADGSQDIGQLYEFLQPGGGTEIGWPLDQWFSGNLAPTYRNIFDETSFPNSKSNANASSFVTIKDFTAKGPRMAFSVETGSTELQRLSVLDRTFSPSKRSLPATVIPTALVLTSDDSVFVFQKNGSSKTGDPSGLLSPAGGRFSPAALEGTKTYLVGAQDSTLFIWDLDTTTTGVSLSVTLTSVQLGASITTTPMILDSLGTALVVVGDETGRVHTVRLDGAIQSTSSVTTFPILGLLANPAIPGSYYCTTQNSILQGATVAPLPASTGGWKIVGGQVPEGMLIVVAEVGGTRVRAFDASLSTTLFDTQISDGSIRDVVIADVDNDGRNDVITTAGSRLFALNSGGILLDRFPVQLTDGSEFTGSPLVADLDGDGKRELVIRSTTGVIHAFRSGVRALGGFPFQIAPQGEGSLALFATSTGNTGILSANESGAVAAWELNKPYTLLPGDWQGFLGNAAHSSYNVGPVTVPGLQVSGFLPKERVYNWPNPVYGSSTNIRFFTTDPASITVKIFDLSGESVTELRGDSPGGIDNEIPWDVSDVQSGVYVARVEASSGSRTESVIFKIAVVK